LYEKEEGGDGRERRDVKGREEEERKLNTHVLRSGRYPLAAVSTAMILATRLCPAFPLRATDRTAFLTCKERTEGSKNERTRSALELTSFLSPLSFPPSFSFPPVANLSLELATHVSGVGSDDSGVKGESSGLGGGGDGDGLQVGESRVLERVDVSEVSRLGREDGSLDGSLNDEGVVLPEEEPLKVGRHLERGGKVEGAVEEEERKERKRGQLVDSYGSGSDFGV